jgi:hypothetical protein
MRLLHLLVAAGTTVAFVIPEPAVLKSEIFLDHETSPSGHALDDALENGWPNDMTDAEFEPEDFEEDVLDEYHPRFFKFDVRESHPSSRLRRISSRNSQSLSLLSLLGYDRARVCLVIRNATIFDEIDLLLPLNSNALQS